jgi:hypothetical protein
VAPAYLVYQEVAVYTHQVSQVHLGECGTGIDIKGGRTLLGFKPGTTPGITGGCTPTLDEITGGITGVVGQADNRLVRDLRLRPSNSRRSARSIIEHHRCRNGNSAWTRWIQRRTRTPWSGRSGSGKVLKRFKWWRPFDILRE